MKDSVAAACIIFEIIYKPLTHRASMTKSEEVTGYTLKDNRSSAGLCAALDEHLQARGIAPEEYGFLSAYSGHAGPVPNFRWLVAFAVEGGSEGYYVHIGAIKEGVYTNLGFCKTWTPGRAYAIATEAQRFLTAVCWN